MKCNQQGCEQLVLRSGPDSDLGSVGSLAPTFVLWKLSWGVGAEKAVVRVRPLRVGCGHLGT